MKIKNLLTCVLAALSAGVAWGNAAMAQPAPIAGTVFIDANGNGVRDAGERGAAGVSVSNQDAIVVTDSVGRFQIAPGKSGVIFMSVPDGFESVSRFWRASADQDMSFALRRVPTSRSFVFVHASDTHLEQASLDRTRRFRTMVDSIRPSFALITGDLVRDAMSQTEKAAAGYFDLVQTEFHTFKTPLWVVPGNHDHFGIIRSRSHADSINPLYGRNMYRHYFGPDYYSFTHSGVHFVALNTLMADDSAYYGRVDSVQLEWLKRDVQRLPAGMPIVTFNHIPLVSASEILGGFLDMALVSSIAHVDGKPVFRHTVSNALDVISALRTHPTLLALGGHTHTGEQLHFETGSMSIRFEQAAAIVGGSDMGPFTIRSGFTVYHVRDGHIDAGQFVPLDPIDTTHK